MTDCIKITILSQHEDAQTELSLEKGESFFGVLQKAGFFDGACCGGIGTCGQCKVQFLKEAPLPTPSDRRLLSPAQLREGWRLACKCKIVKDCVIAARQMRTTKKMDVQAGIIPEFLQTLPVSEGEAVVCDIGTTTIVMQRIDKQTHHVCATYRTINPQRAYGSDVISRLQAAMHGKDLRTDVISTLLEGAKQLEVDGEPIYVSGNTAMMYLLLGFDAGELALAPFKPSHLQFEKTCVDGLTLIFTPCLSAFVGGDIYAGMYEILQADRTGNQLLLDLGTNGEMVLLTEHAGYATATAAGPAFEGMATAGIWGADLIRYVADAYEMGIVDAYGTFDETHENGLQMGDVFLRQEDVRALQLAKAAVRAGIDVLLKKAQLTYEQIDSVYLAGGFGYYIDPLKASLLGIFPKELVARTIAIGNASLWGSYAMALQCPNDSQIRNRIKNTTVINLANTQEFNEKYLNYINFPEIRK